MAPKNIWGVFKGLGDGNILLEYLCLTQSLWKKNNNITIKNILVDL